MAGNSSIQNDQTVTFTDNMSFDGTDRGGAMVSDGQLWIGSTSSNRPNNGGHVRLGTLSSTDGSINIVNGPGSIDLSALSNTLCPNENIFLIDDFFPQNGTDPSAPGQLMWDILGGSTSNVSTNPNHPGIVAIPSVSASDSGIMLSRSSNNGPFITIGGGEITVNFTSDLVALSTVGNRYTAYIGFGDDTFSANPANGIFFSYTDNVNSGNWVINCRAAGVTTAVNTTVAATTGFHTYGIIINSDATSVSFYIDGTVVGTAITTNIPTLPISPEFGLTWTSGNTPQMQIDLFWFFQTLNNPRPGGCVTTPRVIIPTFSPNAILQEFDDFIGWSNNSGGYNAALTWNGLGPTIDPIDGTADHPGMIRIRSRASAGVTGIVSNEIGDNSLEPIVPGGGVLSVSWVARINTLSVGGNTYRQNIGLADALTLYNFTDTFVNAIFFSYTDTVNSGNWVINCTAASVTTSVNTSVPADTNFHTFTVTVNAGATSVSFYIDNVLVGSAITTTIPTVALLPFINQVRTAGTTSTVDIDLFWITINLTNPRPGPAPITGSNGTLIQAYRATAISTTVTSADATIGVTDTSAARTITMPASPAFIGQTWTIKDESAGASVNSITVDGNGHNIVGGTSAATYDITTNGGSISLYWNGTTFQIV